VRLDEGFEWSVNLFQRRRWTPIFQILFRHSPRNSLQSRKISADIASNRDEIQTGHISCVYSVATVSVRCYRTLRGYVLVCVCVLMYLRLRVQINVCARARARMCVRACAPPSTRPRAMLRYAFKIPAYETHNDGATVWGGQTYITVTICKSLTAYNNELDIRSYLSLLNL